MNTGIISSRYARALLKFVDSNGGGETVCAQAKKLEAAISAVPEFGLILADARAVEPSRKFVLLKTALEPEDMDPGLEKFLKLVLKNGRIRDIRLILHSFVDMYYRSKGIRFATLTTAVPAGPEFGEKIRARVAELTGGEVRLEEKTDPDIIGGLLLTVGDYRLDASVRGQLETLRKEFIDKNKRIV